MRFKLEFTTVAEALDQMMRAKRRDRDVEVEATAAQVARLARFGVLDLTGVRDGWLVTFCGCRVVQQ